MDKPNEVLIAALTRPINLLAPGLGLLLALWSAPWWVFPFSLVPYALLVFLATRDPEFVAKTHRPGGAKRGDDVIGWPDVFREFRSASLQSPLERLERSERKLTAEVAAAPDASRPMIAACLAQVRSAARLGIDLARRVRDFDSALASGPDPARSRLEGEERRQQAARTNDAQARQEFLNAALALDEAAAHTDSMQMLRERTLAQLESLAASLESASVRAVRLRIATGGEHGGAGEITESLRIDVDAVRETLAAFEESAPDAPASVSNGGTIR